MSDAPNPKPNPLYSDPEGRARYRERQRIVNWLRQEAKAAWSAHSQAGTLHEAAAKRAWYDAYLAFADQLEAELRDSEHPRQHGHPEQDGDDGEQRGRGDERGEDSE